MIIKPYPTHSEISNVINIILDDIDGIFLLAETSKGNYPVNAVIELVNTAKEAETIAWDCNNKEKFKLFKIINYLDLFQAIIVTSVDTANLINASAIICITRSGKTLILMSQCKPYCVIFAVTKYLRTAKKLILYRSIYPLLLSGN